MIYCDPSPQRRSANRPLGVKLHDRHKRLFDVGHEIIAGLDANGQAQKILKYLGVRC
jgi:hypothetical protein